MDWLGIGKDIAKLGLPLLGTALGGPAGGAVATLVSNALGIDDPDPAKVADALERDPEVSKGRLARLQLDRQHELEVLVLNGQIEQMHETQRSYRSELSTRDPYITRWRPRLGRRVTDIIVMLAIGYILLMFGGLGILVALPDGVKLLASMVDLVGEIGSEIMVLLGGAFALLGYSVRRRSIDKAAERGDAPKAGLIETVIGAIRK